MFMYKEKKMKIDGRVIRGELNEFAPIRFSKDGSINSMIEEGGI